MKVATIYEAFDGKQFPSKEECVRYEADHAESRLVGLTAEQVRSALSYEDVDLAGVIEKMGGICAAARRGAGDLKRRKTSVNNELIQTRGSGDQEDVIDLHS